MSNKQLGILIGAIFGAVVLAYLLFNGFPDTRSADERKLDEAIAEQNKAFDNMDAAGAEINRIRGH